MHGHPRWCSRISVPRTPPFTIERLRALRLQLDQMRAEDVRFTPYTDRYIDFGGYYAISRYRGILRIDDIEEAYMPDRFLRQFGYVQTMPLPRIPPHQEVRLDKGRGTRVSYAPIYDAWTSRHLEETRVSFDGLVPAHSPWLVDDAYMPWYTTHCHPYILPTSIAVQIPVDRPPPVPVSDSRVR